LNTGTKAQGALIRTFQGHSAGVSSVAFLADGGSVLSGSNDKTIKLWDATAFLPLPVIRQERSAIAVKRVPCARLSCCRGPQDAARRH
jgi:WD40 repeat protein